ncbi:MAG: hypothetical protein EZS28_027519 [Streblomastix strix]|uniref:Uncharacterized protein n=1 Tax=Streblomastix strix TaxID=222440 RepID=A0A5J4V3B2_9EUKA|nr:MAG: hypothetical protein EZS28_027519 [Streblomastix strix]
MVQYRVSKEDGTVQRICSYKENPVFVMLYEEKYYRNEQASEILFATAYPDIVVRLLFGVELSCKFTNNPVSLKFATIYPDIVVWLLFGADLSCMFAIQLLFDVDIYLATFL